ncbi:MAG: hypothetical protein L3K16_08735 [Thermoplasmata archaeon]|nr:hypothetical protein [Thermoplasmata archaeon]
MPASAPHEDDWDDPVPRTKPRRWVVLAVVVLFVSAGAVGVLLFVQPQSCGACTGCGSTTEGPQPIGGAPPLALGSPSPGGGPDNRSYTIEVAPGSGLRWGELSFEVEGSTGGALAPQPDWSLFAKNMSAGSTAPFATYEFGTGTWTKGGSVLMTSAQDLVLEFGTTDLVGQGDQVVATYSTACLGPGTVSEPLP